MGRLIEDLFLRRMAQVILLLFFFSLLVLPVVATTIVLLQLAGWLDGALASYARTFLHFISLPLVDSTSQVATVILTALPVLVATVCFQFDPSASPAAVVDKVNNTGRISALLLVLGGAAAAISVVVFNSLQGTVATITQDPEYARYAKGVLGGVLGFQVVYLAKIIGWEIPK
jgi:hypothetical protein